mmetsp:Transcript_28439/g.70673  ORF Transcript_28439/g.70673 Transcript_28439/m.70673 type:complete len:235 (+) Transcript_28439:199-903(+)
MGAPARHALPPLRLAGGADERRGVHRRRRGVAGAARRRQPRPPRRRGVEGMRRARHAAGRPWRARVLLARVGGAARAAGPRRREWRRAARRRVRLAVRALLPLDALGAAGGRRRAVGKVGAHGGVVGRGGRLPRGARRHAARIDQRHACTRLPRRRAPRVAVARGGSERAGGPSAVRPRRSRCGRRAVGARRRHRREGRPRVRGIGAPNHRGALRPTSHTPHHIPAYPHTVHHT